MDCSVRINDIVVADSVESALSVPAVDVGHGDLSPFGSCRAVDDDFFDFAHNKVNTNV